MSDECVTRLLRNRKMDRKRSFILELGIAVVKDFTSSADMRAY